MPFSAITDSTAETMRAIHPHRLRFGLFSDQNPVMQVIKPLAEIVRANRTPVSKGQFHSRHGKGRVVLDHDLPRKRR
jgi:hypothetical protein